MYGVLFGMALGAMVSTEKGREIGNQIWDMGTQAVKKAMDYVQQQKPKSSE